MLRFSVRHWHGLIVLLTVASLLVAACQAPASPPAPTQAPAAPAAKEAPKAAPAKAALEKATLNLGNVRLTVLSPVYVADKLGYFKDEGLTINFKDLAGGAEGIPALEAGSLDISHSPFVTLLQSRDQGFNFVSLVPNNSSPTKPPHEAGMFARKDDDSIKTLKDLEGKTVVVNTIKGLQWLMAAGAIRKAGGDEKKVKFIEAPFDKMQDGLMNKLFDAINTSEPFTTVAMDSGKTKLLSYPYLDTAPGLDIGGYVSTRAFAEKNPNTIKAFARAMKRVHKEFTENPEKARKELGEVTKTAPDLMAKVTFPVWSQGVNVESLRTLVDLCLEFGFIKNKTKVEDFLWETAYP